MILTVDAEIQRKGGAFVMPELYGSALCVHLPDLWKTVIVIEKPQDMVLFFFFLLIPQKDNKKWTERNPEKIGDKYWQGDARQSRLLQFRHDQCRSARSFFPAEKPLHLIAVDIVLALRFTFFRT